MDIINVQDLTKSYGGRTVLDRLSFRIPAGETVAVVGPNGTGKTTMLEILMTLRNADSGSIRIMDRDLTAQRDEIRSKIGVMLQEGGMYLYIKLKEALDLFASFYNVGREKIRQTESQVPMKRFSGPGKPGRAILSGTDEPRR